MINQSKHWAIEIPTAPGEFVRRLKSKHRSYLRKMQRDLESYFPGSVSIRHYRRPEEVPLALREIETVAARTYQRSLGSGVQNDVEHSRRFREAASAGRLRVWLLHAGGKPRAYRVGEVYGDTIHGAGIGYDPELSNFRLGNLLLVHAVDELSREGLRYYDLGLGEAAYKEQFGTHFWNDVSLTIFARSFQGQFAKVTIAVPFHINRCLRSIVGRWNQTERIKRLWRRKLAKNAVSTGQENSSTRET